MIPFSPRVLKSQAVDRLQSSGSNARQLVLIHSGLTVLISLIISSLNIYLDDQIGTTGGLSGLGTRSILQTVQTMLQLASTVITPFWAAGFLSVSMRWAADQTSAPKDLLYGFKRFSSVIGFQFFSTAMTILLMTASGYAAGFIFSMTSYAEPLIELLEPILASGTMDFTLVPTEALAKAYFPLLFLWMTMMIPWLIVFRYGLRLAMYFLMDFPGMGAMRAIGTSMVLMRGKKMQLFRLDLSYWWYYALEVLLMVVCYLDVILPLLGVTLPFNATVGYFVFLALYCVLQLFLHIWKKAEIQTAYALAYHHFSHPDHQDPPIPI